MRPRQPEHETVGQFAAGCAVMVLMAFGFWLWLAVAVAALPVTR